MSYSIHAITSVLEIPALFSAYATGLGYIVDDTDPDLPQVTAPFPTDAITFQLAALEVGTTHTVTLSAPGDLEVNTSQIVSPKINNSVSLPTSVAFIGGLSPEPFIAIIVQYGDNLFRHLYLGYMEKLGGYTGGEVISASNGPSTSSASARSYLGGNRYLFNARQAVASAGASGGVLVRHADNDDSWRAFRSTTSLNPVTAFTGQEALGGFGDAVNDGYLARGRSPFAGVNQLTPINLFVPQPILGDCNFRPIGCPAGVRLVNMQDLPVGARIEIAGEYWRCYPATSRSSQTSMPPGTSNWPSRETSFMVGYAYFEGA